MPSTLVKTRKLQIQETAERMFCEKGYSGTSIRHLAAQLQIEPASLYSHIKNKEDLLKNTCFRMAEAFFEAFHALDHTQDSAIEKLQNHIKAHIQILLQNPEASTVFFKDWIFLSEPHLAQFKQLRKKYEVLFLQLLTEGIVQNTFRVDDLEFTIQTLFSAMNMTLSWPRHKNNWTATIIAEKLTDILLTGILKTK